MKYATRRAVGLGLTTLTGLAAFLMVAMLVLILFDVVANGAGHVTWTFLSQPPSPNVASRLPDTEHISVFLPCTPNPTTGFFFYLPRRDVIELDISVESAMTLIMSAGAAQPGMGSDQQRRLAALADAARLARAARSPPTSPDTRPTAPVK